VAATVSFAAALSGCNVVRRFPVIVADEPTFNEDSSDSAKVLRATISQDNGPIDPALRVTCDFSFSRRDQVPSFRTRSSTRLGNQRRWECSFPASTRNAMRDGHVLRFEWIVRSTNGDGDPVIVARTGVKDFAIGCQGADAPGAAWARNQSDIVGQFGGLTTIERIAAAGYVPTHFTADGSQKVFRGMGVAFARRIDVLGTTNIVPSLPIRTDSPNLLLFSPGSRVDDDSTLAPALATFSLVGWAYTTNLSSSPIDHPPLVNCFPLHEWFIHEQGAHTVDGGFTPGPGPFPIGLRHARLWDLHVWSRPSGVPALGIFNHSGPGGSVRPADGFAAPAASFFYPEFDEP
jgi:hypothetical protein